MLNYSVAELRYILLCHASGFGSFNKSDVVLVEITQHIKYYIHNYYIFVLPMCKDNTFLLFQQERFNKSNIFVLFCIISLGYILFLYVFGRK